MAAHKDCRKRRKGVFSSAHRDAQFLAETKFEGRGWGEGGVYFFYQLDY